MLGNLYFMARKYPEAAGALEKALTDDKKNKGIRRKLIICYSQIGQTQKAIEIFLSLVKEDVDFIINTDPVADDCPCPELVYDMERKLANNQNSLDFTMILAIYWLYCNLDKSIMYFERARDLAPDDQYIKSVLSLLAARSQFGQSQKY